MTAIGRSRGKYFKERTSEALHPIAAGEPAWPSVAVALLVLPIVPAVE
jgi:hypothetical protein